MSSRSTKGQLLARRLVDNRAALLDAYRSSVKAINDGRAITPAAEWLVDSYHLVEKQIHEIHSDLPPGYYRQLPKLAAGPFAGYPRVFGIAWAFVAHTDSRFDSEMLVRFVRAYQRYSRSPLANSGRCRSRCGLFWSRISDASRARSPRAVPRGRWRTASPTVCLAQAEDRLNPPLSFS